MVQVETERQSYDWRGLLGDGGTLHIGYTTERELQLVAEFTRLQTNGLGNGDCHLQQVKYLTSDEASFSQSHTEFADASRLNRLKIW